MDVTKKVVVPHVSVVPCDDTRDIHYDCVIRKVAEPLISSPAAA